MRNSRRRGSVQSGFHPPAISDLYDQMAWSSLIRNMIKHMAFENTFEMKYWIGPGNEIHC